MRKFPRLYLFTLLFCSSSVIATDRVVSTFGNTVGISSDDRCCYIERDSGKSGLIRCVSGKTFGEDIPMGTIIGSSTGTPPHLMFSNYIGSRIIQEPEPGLLGSGKREIYCVGPCIEKKYKK